MKAKKHPAVCKMERSMACFSRDISGNELHRKGDDNITGCKWICLSWVLTHMNECMSAVFEFSPCAISLQSRRQQSKGREKISTAGCFSVAVRNKTQCPAPPILLPPWLCHLYPPQVNTFVSFVFPMVVISVLNTIIANQLMVMFKQAAQENQVCTIGGQQTMLSMSMEPSRVQALKHGVRVLRKYSHILAWNLLDVST